MLIIVDALTNQATMAELQARELKTGCFSNHHYISFLLSLKRSKFSFEDCLAYYQISPKKCLAAIIKILYLFFMLSCIHLYHFFLVSIQSLQCIHCLFLASEASREVGNLTKRKNLHTPVYGVEEFVWLSVCLSVCLSRQSVCLSVCYQIRPQLSQDWQNSHFSIHLDTGGQIHVQII